MRLASIAVAALFAAGCAHAKPSLTVHMEPQANSNGGLACYVLVRAVTPQRFVTQDYRTVSALVETPDESVRGSVVAFPSRATQITITLRPDERLAVYAFFRDVGGQWRLLLDAPTPSRLRLQLGENSLRVLPDAR